MTRCELSVLLVTYNSAPHLPACLDALRAALHGLDAEVLVHDNGSTDETLELLSSRGDVSVSTTGENLGFAAACNLLARRSGGRHLLLLNPDTVIEQAAPHALLEAAARHPDAGLVGARAVSPDGHTLRSSAQGRMTLHSLLCFATGLSTVLAGRRWADPESLPGWDRETGRPVPMLSGGALLASRQTWDRLGGFDTSYFMYGEDADLCLRAWRAGYAPRFEPAAVVVHDVGASSSPGRKQVLLHRGKVTLLRRRWHPAAAALGVRLLLAGVGLRALAARLGVFSAKRGRIPPEAWTTAWRSRHEWLPGW